VEVVILRDQTAKWWTTRVETTDLAEILIVYNDWEVGISSEEHDCWIEKEIADHFTTLTVKVS
jgi:hypothetical protein